MFDHERDWALYTKSTGGERLDVWYRDDLDVFEFEGVTYTRIGPVVKARTAERARELIAIERRKDESWQRVQDSYDTSEE